MADYDSDSTDGEYTETSVLLGYASKEGGDEVVSRLGGTPEWLEAEKPPSASLARCKVCKDMMVLLLQLNGELPEKFPGHERRLYVFACARSSCRRRDGSIRAVRAIRVWEEQVAAAKAQATSKEIEEKKEEPKKNGPGLGEALFGGAALGCASANPFSSNANPFSSSASSSNPFSTSFQPSQPAQSSKPTPTETTPAALSKTFAETLSLNTEPSAPPPPPEPWPESSKLPKPYPTLYLAEADYETLEPTSTKVPDNARMDTSGDSSEPSILDREAFESSMDGTFQKFADRMSQNPDQVIRYEFGGSPLLYTKTDSVGVKLSAATSHNSGMPGCPNCGGRRIFEVQLTPNAIAELEADDLSLEGMEWGTIIVGVCEGDCVPRGTKDGEAGYLEEWAGVQWEELTKRK